MPGGVQGCYTCVVPMFTPAYLELFNRGELERRTAEARRRLEHCDLCPWECGSNRLAGPGSICRTGELAIVCDHGPHHGEESVISGRSGSGTIFFGGCNLRCQYCQNHTISMEASGRTAAADELAAMMLDLQERGCHNINLVSPTHVIAQVLAALVIAVRLGLRLPLVYNTGGYDAPGGLALLDGVVDIYMPDMKYADPAPARQYSKAARYPEVNRAAVKEMHRQVGDLQIDADGIARRGLLVRHLVLPNRQSGVEQIARFLASEVSPNTYLNLMDQYRPEYNVLRYPNQFPKLRRALTPPEYARAWEAAADAGLTRLRRD